jgi:iron complex outermembrane receptor protein
MFSPETIKAIQAGVKSRFLDNRVQINAEAFHYDLDGYQTSFLLPGPGGLLIGGSVNAQNAELYGAELEASFVLSQSDRLDIAPAYLHAEHKKFLIPATGTDLSNKPMSNSPQFTLTGNYSHRFALTTGAGVTAHVETHYESSQWADFRLTPGTHVPSFWRHSADVTYNPSGDRWTVGAFIRNITNDGSLMHAVGGLGLYTVGMPYPPRTFGARVTANF